MLDAFEDSDSELNSTAGVNIANACDSSDCELDPTAGVNIANAFEKATLLDAFDSDSSQPDALPKTAMPNVRPRQAKPKVVRDAFLPAFVRSGPPAKTVGDHLADIQMIPNEKQKLRKRIARLAVSDNKRLRMYEETHSAIAGCWNHLKLSRNERLPVGVHAPNRKQRGTRRVWRHKRAWTIQGTIAGAYSAIGAACSNATGLRRTRREIDQVSCVSLAHRHATVEHQRSWKQSVRVGVRNVSWLLLERAFDTTPVNIIFGILQSLLAPVARFWLRVQVGKNNEGRSIFQWRYVSRDELQHELKGCEPRCGSLEMLAQTTRISWQETSKDLDLPTVNSEVVPMPPLYLQNSSGSNVITGLETSLPQFDMESLKDLAAYIPFVVLALASDAVSSNLRLKLSVAESVLEHNQAAEAANQAAEAEEAAEAAKLGFILLWDQICAAHILHNLVTKTAKITIWLQKTQ